MCVQLDSQRRQFHANLSSQLVCKKQCSPPILFFFDCVCAAINPSLDKSHNLYLMGKRWLFSFLERTCCSCCCSYCFPPKYIILTHTHTPFFWFETVSTLVDTYSADPKSVKGIFFFSILFCEKGKILSGSKRGTFAIKMSHVLVPGYFVFCFFFFSRGCCQVFQFLNNANSTHVRPIK